MNLLLDSNISWRVITKLAPYFGECFHADQIGLKVPARDIDIWNYAQRNSCIIVTNDDDFLNLANAKGFPPKIVLLRTGNQSNNYLVEILIKHQKSIADLYASNEYGVLEIF